MSILVVTKSYFSERLHWVATTLMKYIKNMLRAAASPLPIRPIRKLHIMKVVIGKDFVNSPLFYKRVTSHKVKIARFHGAVEHKNIVPLFCSTGIFGESEMIMVKAEGMKIPGKERKVRSDKKHRVGGPYLDDETNQKLKHIAKACDTTPPKILEEMAKYLLNHPGWVVYIQDRFNIKNDDPFRITPIIENGKVIY